MNTDTPTHEYTRAQLDAALGSLFDETAKLRFSIAAAPFKGPGRRLLDSYLAQHLPCMLRAEKLVRALRSLPPIVRGEELP
jgi:hypothetical protein